MRRAVRHVASVGAALAVLLTGCTHDDAKRPSESTRPAAATTTRAITADEASKLADVLVRNHDLGGASVRAVVPYGTTTFDLEGDIDWADHVGRVRVSTEGTATATRPAFDVVFDQKVTFEEVPGLAEALAEQQRAPANWVAKALDPSTSPLHVVLQLLQGLSSTQRDNPVLLQQNGITRAEDVVIDGRPAQVFDLGRSRYFVDTATQRLVRVTAALESTKSEVRIDLTDPGPRAIDVPADGDIVDYSDVVELYASLTTPR